MWGSGDIGFFDRVAPLYNLVHPAPDVEVYRDAFATADRDVERVLDLAGGSGRVARTLAHADIATPVVCDVSPGMLRQARAHAAVVRGDAGRLPFADGAFDAVICTDALHHLPDAPAAVRECARVLAPGGVFVLIDFDPERLLGRAVELGEGAIGMASTFRTREDAAALLHDAGFETTVERGRVTYTVVGAKPGEEL
jgi:demethylmenaquinone methyltransferase/2-methoxy-6-polyprenyl-1,4-benzoquinol methylase